MRQRLRYKCMREHDREMQPHKSEMVVTVGAKEPDGAFKQVSHGENVLVSFPGCALFDTPIRRQFCACMERGRKSCEFSCGILRLRNRVHPSDGGPAVDERKGPTTKGREQVSQEPVSERRTARGAGSKAAGRTEWRAWPVCWLDPPLLPSVFPARFSRGVARERHQGLRCGPRVHQYGGDARDVVMRRVLRRVRGPLRRRATKARSPFAAFTCARAVRASARHQLTRTWQRQIQTVDTHIVGYSQYLGFGNQLPAYEESQCHTEEMGDVNNLSLHEGATIGFGYEVAQLCRLHVTGWRALANKRGIHVWTM